MNYQDMSNEVLFMRGKELIHKWDLSCLWLYKHREEIDNYESKYNSKQNQIALIAEILSRIDRSVDGRRKDEEE